MRGSGVAIAIGALAIVGFGAWLLSSSSPAPPSPTAASGEVVATNRPRAPNADRARGSIAPSPLLPARRSAELSPGLATDLAARDPRIRRAAVRELAESSDPDPAVLLAASRDPDLDVGAISTHALGKLYADGRVPLRELVARATDRGLNERVRARALNGLGLVENADAAAVLIELLRGGDALERRTAAALLARQDIALAVPALIRALGDADEYVRANAVDALKARSRGRDFGTDAGAWQEWWRSRRG